MSACATADPRPSPLPATLALTPQQQEAIAKIVRSARERAATLAIVGDDHLRQLHRTLLEQQGDPSARRNATRSVVEVMTEVTALRIDTAARIVATLTPEQRQFVVQKEEMAGYAIDLLDLLGLLFGVPKI